MWKLKDKYAIAGIGYTDYSKSSGRSTATLASQACLAAVRDAGGDISDIDGIVSYSYNDSSPGTAVATELGIPGLMFGVDLSAGGNGPAVAIATAAMAVEAGLATQVLCYRAMNGRSSFRLGSARELRVEGIEQFMAPFGWVTYPQQMAMWCRRHMVKYGTTSADLGTIAVTFREHAALNERAMQRKRITIDDYMAARMVVEPFRLLDICLESDGACAVLVTSAERARDLKRPPVYITSAAYGGGKNQGENLGDPLRWADHSENYSRYIAADLWAAAGVGPQDVDVAQIYDCFTYSVLMQLEGFGFCNPGESREFIKDGRISIGGALPLNTHGGLLSEAYIHGMNHVIEAVEQLRGQSGPRQVADARIALVTSGAMTCGGALLLRN